MHFLVTIVVLYVSRSPTLDFCVIFLKSRLWKSSVALQRLEWGPMQSKSRDGFGYLECSTHAQ